MKFSKRLIVTMAVLAAGNSPDFTSAENLRKQSDVKFTTPAGLTLNMDDLNFVRRHLEEKYPGAPTFTFNDLVSAVAKIEPVSYTDGDDYHINRGKCLFLLQVIDAKLSELKMDDHFSFVELYGPSICGTAMPTSAPTTDKPTTDSPTLAPTTNITFTTKVLLETESEQERLLNKMNGRNLETDLTATCESVVDTTLTQLLVFDPTTSDVTGTTSDTTSIIEDPIGKYTVLVATTAEARCQSEACILKASNEVEAKINELLLSTEFSDALKANAADAPGCEDLASAIVISVEPTICGTVISDCLDLTDESCGAGQVCSEVVGCGIYKCLVTPSLPPSVGPSLSPTHQPTDEPSSPPTIGPSLSPTHQPSSPPSVGPSFSPTRQPTSPPSANPTLTPTSSPFCAPVGSDCTVASDCCLSGIDDGQCCKLKTPGYCWDLDPDALFFLKFPPKFGELNCSAVNNCTTTAGCSNLGMTDPVCYTGSNARYCSTSTRPENGGTCQDEGPSFCRRALREGEEPVSEDVPLERRLQIIKGMEPFGAKADATFSFKYDIISKKSCKALVTHMENSLECDINSGVEHPVGADSSYETDPAYDAWVPFEGGVSNQYNKKLYVDQIVDLIGADETMKLIDFFRESFGEDLNIDCMYLVQHGNPGDELFNVPWHKDDYSTMEVTLNDDYDGGEVLHMNAAGVHKTEARPGSATAHTSDIVHGITPNTNGAKYMLILKHHFNRPDKKGLVRLSKELVANAVASRA